MDMIAQSTEQNAAKFENGVQEKRLASDLQIESFINRSVTTEHVLPEATRRQMNFVKNQFEAWYEAVQVQLGKNIEELSKKELSEVLKEFYLTARKKDGSHYKLCSFQTIRRCLSLIFQHDYKIQNLDIASDPAFAYANAVFSQMIHNLRGREEGTTGGNEAWLLTAEKLMKLYQKGQLDFFDTTSPKVLLQSVFFYICYYTGIGKLSVMKRILMTDIEEVSENDNVIAYNFHLRKYLPTKTGDGPFTINQIPGKPWCPVLTIQQYLSHRNNDMQSFFQKPLARSQCEGSNIWFKKCRFKDLFPLTNMCQEAGIDPPLASGCFNKRRISAEIRFEMTFVYTQLFPSYFGHRDNTNSPNLVKRKPSRKLSHINSTAPFIEPIDLTDPLDINTDGAKTGFASATRTATENRMPKLPPTTLNTRDIPTTRTNVEEYTKRHLLNQAIVSSTPSLKDSPPSIAVGQVYSYRKENTTGDPPSMVHVNAFSRSHSITAMQETNDTTESYTINPPNNYDINPPKNYDINPPKNYDINPPNNYDISPPSNYDISPSNSYNTDPTKSYETEPRIASSSVKSCVQNTSISNQHTTLGAARSSSNDSASYSPNRLKRGIQNVAERASQYSGSSSEDYYYPAPQRTDTNIAMHANTVTHNSPSNQLPKRSRFDDSSYTFLREISASAREQGKGAVMLLVSLLDDLSNNKGKQLLKDILQEMKII